MQASRLNLALLAVAACVFCSTAATAATSTPAAESSVDPKDHRSQQIAQRIDALLEQQWTAAGIEPAPDANDSEFLRRAYLDLVGVIPRVSEVREFLADERPDKRALLVDRLLASPRHATHMATTWRNRILPMGVEPERNREAIALQKWLRTRFARNLRYDNLVGELLLTLGGDELGPGLYFQANDLMPEKLAASAAELFLGVQLQCAECHDHPYADWSQRDFWGLAAFFARTQARDERRMAMGMGPLRLIDTDRGDVRLPESDEIVPPKFPRGEAASDDVRQSRRVQLALWMTSRDNTFFSRAAVNWAWAHMFGRPLVDSIDELDAHRASVHAQLLIELADHFAASGFDLRELWRTLAGTRAYQLSSRHPSPESTPPHLFARMQPKPLTPEQLFDSFALLAPTQIGPRRTGAPAGSMAASLDEDPLRLEFVRRMRAPPGDATEFRAGTLQALMLMNGNVAAGVSSHDGSLLGALDAPLLTDDDRIDALFLATLSRPPEPDEKESFAQVLATCESPDDRHRALSDMLWVLLNSTEFAFNH